VGEHRSSSICREGRLTLPQVQNHFYYENLSETHAIWKEFRKLLDEYPERMTQDMAA